VAVVELEFPLVCRSFVSTAKTNELKCRIKIDYSCEDSKSSKVVVQDEIFLVRCFSWNFVKDDEGAKKEVREVKWNEQL